MLKRRMPSRIAIVGLLVCAGVLYTRELARAPVYLGWDEARTAVQGYSLATTGRDMSGARTPLFFHITDPLIPNHSSWTWWQPMLFYLTAAVLLVAPFAEWSVRLPNVALAVLNLWLVYVVARRLFPGRWYGVLAAFLLALTPAHFFFARLAQDYFLSLTFALLWLWCLIRYLQTDRVWLAATMGFVLGVGIYTHISSWIVMPFYLTVTCVVLAITRKPLRATIAPLLGFAVAMLPLAAWLWYQPTLFQDMFRNYGVVTTLNTSERVTIYWEYFNPSFLFFSGGADPMWATRRAGVFLLAIAVLLPFGIWNIWQRSLSIPRAVLLAGFFFAPVPIVVALPEAPHYATARNLLVVPFGVLISVAGVEFLVAGRRRIGKIVAAILIVSVPIQFVSFARDYFTDYQQRSSFRHDFLNVRGVVESVIATDDSSRIPGVYLSDTLGAGKAVQWKFHLLTHHRPDLWERTRYFAAAAFNPDDIPRGSLLVLAAGDERGSQLLDAGHCAMVQVVKDVTDAPAATILRRN
jgi:hypothetical protein